jgi:hypothetical protein
MSYISLAGGIPNPLKNMKVSWDDEIPNIWKNKIHVPNHQAVLVQKNSHIQISIFWIPFMNQKDLRKISQHLSGHGKIGTPRSEWDIYT